ncbi:DUF3883 domain-containing protein [Agrobacterium sp. NPDC090273]|uniref:DUF3883 domain-containing protein n=1 Tax=Agrobacterium sp. NPDC090273 TaxID=3363919 RepID=UPI00383BF143
MPFLMTWKPEGWPYENVQRMLKEYSENGSVTEPWRINAFKRSFLGDRVWLLRQGSENRGIFGVGEIAGQPSMRIYQGKSHMMVPVRFTRLVDPRGKLLISIRELASVLETSQIGAQASGNTIKPEQSAALDALLPSDPREREGTDWTEDEISALVTDYFAMLQKEVSGTAYSKTEHRRNLLRSLQRSEGSIERKHQNVSAVLHRLGFRWIQGYKPLGNVQTALVPVVAHFLRSAAKDLDSVAEAIPAPSSTADVFVTAPTDALTINASSAIDPVARKFDIAKRDARNKALGQGGEEFVVELEKARLTELGLKDKIDQVVWASRDEGDGLGYDIRSFADDGTAIFIEVKTTRGDINAPFFITERERLIAERKGTQYLIYRVFSFGREPKVFVIPGPLENGLELRPTAYRASVRPTPKCSQTG